jgi:hypothetical protein
MPEATVAAKLSSEGPDFLGIGAQKAGTTWLANALGRHPAVWLPPVKELHFWNERESGVHRRSVLARLVGRDWHDARWRRYARQAARRGFLSRQPGMRFWHWRFLFARRDLAWYRSLFVRAARPIAGEITPAYQLLRDETLAELRAMRPDVRLLLVVREPVDRAWSQARMVLARARGRRMEEVPESELRDFLVHPDVVARGRYADSIDRWLRHFDRSQLRVELFESLAHRPLAVLDGLCSFLGVATFSELGLAAPAATHVGQPARIPAGIRELLVEQSRSDTERLIRDHGLPVESWLVSPGGSTPPATARVFA